MKKKFIITRIKEEKFRVGKYLLNEAELINLQIEVSLGDKPSGIVIKSENGNLCAIIEKDGCLSNNIRTKTSNNDRRLQLRLLMQKHIPTSA